MVIEQILDSNYIFYFKTKVLVKRLGTPNFTQVGFIWREKIFSNFTVRIIYINIFNKIFLRIK